MAMEIAMAGMWMQDPGSTSSAYSTLMTVFVGVIALVMLLQGLVLIVVAVVAAKAAKRGMAIAEEVRAKSMPILHDAQELIRDMTPKVKAITENLVETSHVVRAKVQEFDATAKEINATATEINAKTRAQVSRVDNIVTSVLTSTAEITGTIQRGIRAPLREVSGIVNGVKAGLDVLVGRAKGFGRYPGVGEPEDR